MELHLYIEMTKPFKTANNHMTSNATMMALRTVDMTSVWLLFNCS